MKITKKPTAFITGVTGQDGAHLAKLLLSKGYQVYGGYRRGANKVWRLEYLGIRDQIYLIEFQLTEPNSIVNALKEYQFDELYHLAAESYVADSFKYPNVTLEANTHATCNILEAVRLVSPSTRVFFASSSEIYGNEHGLQTLSESAVPKPENPYAISKLAADFFVKMYREKYGLFACVGILFNHEGPLRGGQFVSRKITYNIARLKLRGGEPIALGNLNSQKDWGYAGDYVQAMWLMLNANKPKDFIIATGKLSSVRDLLRIAAIAAGFDPVFIGEGVDEICQDSNTGLCLAVVSEKYFRPFETKGVTGDSSNIERDLGWEKNKNFSQLINEMVVEDISRWESGITSI